MCAFFFFCSCSHSSWFRVFELFNWARSTQRLRRTIENNTDAVLIDPTKFRCCQRLKFPFHVRIEITNSHSVQFRRWNNKTKHRHNVNVNIGRFRECGKEAVVRRIPLSATCPIRFIVIDSVHGVHLDRCNMQWSLDYCRIGRRWVPTQYISSDYFSLFGCDSWDGPSYNCSSLFLQIFIFSRKIEGMRALQTRPACGNCSQ